MDQSPALDHTDEGSKLSHGLVDFYKDIYGRGPVTAKTLFTVDVAVTVMHAVLTPAELTLVAGGKMAEVEQMRLRTAEVAKPRLIAMVEEALERKVTASVTGIGVRDDVGTETFLLAPDGNRRP